MIKIGDFSKLSLVSIKTLRYYDEMGLLKPVHVDQFTGYRYYSASQLPRLHRILALKDLGFSLEQIARVLNEGVSLEQLRGMLRLRQVELQQRISEEQDNGDTMSDCQWPPASSRRFALPLDSTATRHTFVGVPLWLHGPLHQG